MCQFVRSSYEATDPALLWELAEMTVVRRNVLSADLGAWRANQHPAPEPLHTVELSIVKYVR